MQKTQFLYLVLSAKIHCKFLFLLTLFTGLTFQSVSAQEKVDSNIHFTPTEIWQSGIPHIKSYSSDDYKNSPWNFRIIEGDNGFMYIGNAEGIIEFDGNSWDFIPTEQKGWIMAFSKTDNEKVFVGGTQELGFLEPDELGKMKFHPLTDFLEPKYKDFGRIWSTVAVANTVYFSSTKYIFRWDGKTFKTWEAKETFGKIFKVNGSLYVNEISLGLQKLVGDSLRLIPGSEVLVDNEGKFPAKIREILPYQNDQLLLVHSHQGMVVYNGESFEPLNQNSNADLLKSNVYGGVLLSNGDYALGTLTFGIYIIDGKTGAIKRRLGKKHGLASNEIYAIYEDRNGAIWTCGGEGISRIEWGSPFRIFNESSGLKEIVTSVCYSSGKLFAESNGAYQLVKNDLYKESKDLTFEKVGGIRAGRLTGFISNKNAILARNESQIYQISDTRPAQLIAEQGSNFSSFIASNVDDSKFYFTTYEQGLFDLTLIANKWITRPLLQMGGIATGIVEEPEGSLWLSVHQKGLYFLKKQPNTSNGETKFKIKKYDTLSGLPSMSNNYITQFKNEFLVSTENGYHRLNTNDQTFEKFSLWPNQYDEFGNESGVEYGYGVFEDKGELWHMTSIDNENKVFKLSENKLSELKEYSLFSDSDIDYFELMDEISLFVTAKNGILMYNPNEARSFKRNLSTTLRKVWLSNDSLVYAGSDRYKDKEDSFEVPYKNNVLQFEYTLPFYTRSQKNEYQYFLEGFENEWSSWSTETKKNYTNIPEGNYTFKVRSKNIYDEIGSEDSYFFTVLPPLHRTWWAYLIYGLGAIGIVTLYSKWRSTALQKKNVVLENTINTRTLEIRQKNELLNHQTEQLVQLSESKTKLYSNITHEFRTPLTVILGMADTLKSNVKDKRFEGAEKSLEMIRRNGKNLLQLVNEMLDIAKVESGAMELSMVQTDVIPLVKYLSESFHSLAEAKKINLTVYSEIDALEMDIDVNKMASIISNLLSNAIKFTPTNGKIIVHLNKMETKEGEVFSIKVQDNGLGLTEEDTAHLFDRFYQADNQSSPYQEGTGIGLSLAKEFVELMNGTIGVESTLGKGSTFMLQLPVTNTAVKTVNAKITVDPPNETTTNTIKTEPLALDETSALPLALIIEDNEDVAHYLKTCLQEKYQTLHAINGDIGIEMAYEKIPDIIISDVMMPGKDGFEVCGILKTDARTDHIPIVLLTAKVTTEDRLTGLSHGADAYLAKPFNEKELFIRLDQLVLLRKKLVEKIQKDGLNNFLDKRAESPETKFLQRVIQFINVDISNSDFGARDLAAKLHLSESQIYRKLKAITDKSTAVFIRSIRLQKAKDLIETTDKTISEIAYETGFNDPSWFSRAFKEEFGFAPSEVHK